MEREKQLQFISENGKYLIDIDIKLEQKDKGPVFSVCGSVYFCDTGHVFCNGRYYGRNYICSGQCLGEIKSILGRMKSSDKKTLEIIIDLRDKYHLNDLHAGTKKQEKYLEKHLDEHNWDYEKCCQILSKGNLLYDGEYKYGSGWLYRPIPLIALKKIERLIR